MICLKFNEFIDCQTKRGNIQESPMVLSNIGQKIYVAWFFLPDLYFLHLCLSFARTQLPHFPEVQNSPQSIAHILFVSLNRSKRHRINVQQSFKMKAQTGPYLRYSSLAPSIWTIMSLLSTSLSCDWVNTLCVCYQREILFCVVFHCSLL